MSWQYRHRPNRFEGRNRSARKPALRRHISTENGDPSPRWALYRARDKSNSAPGKPGPACVTKGTPVFPSPQKTLSLTLLTLLATATACVDAPESEDLGAHRMLLAEEVFGPLEPGEVLDQVDNQDGTVSYALSPEAFVEEGTLVDAGLVTWRYVGQARFPADHIPSEPVQPYLVTEETHTTTAEQLGIMVRIDNRGRRWVVEHYDEHALAEAILAYDGVGEEEPDLPHEFPGAQATVTNPDETPPLGTWVDFEPHSWEHFLCPAEGNSFAVRSHTWDGEDRTDVSTTHTFQEQAAVKLFMLRDGSNPTTATAGQSQCSGVMVDASHVLTAAHCLSNNPGFEFQTNRVQVCLDTTNECTGNFLGAQFGQGPSGGFFTPSSNARTVIAIDRANGYNHNSATGVDFDDDWAIITLSGAFSTRSLRMSGMSDERMLDLSRTRSFGYPSQRRDGSPSGCTETMTRLQSVEESESPTSTTTKKVRHRLDGTKGQSGSPIYYCPHLEDSLCDEHPRETGFVYGVHAGWNPASQRVVGPKVPNFRAAALAIIGG